MIVPFRRLAWAAFAVVLLVGAIALGLRACHRPTAPGPGASPPIAAHTIILTPEGAPASASAPSLFEESVTPSRGRITVSTRAIVRHHAPGLIVRRQPPDGRSPEVVAVVPPGPMETTLATPDVPVVDSDPEPVVITVKEPEPSRLGLLAGTFPGVVAGDVQVVRRCALDQVVSGDLELNLFEVGIGLSVGGKAFGEAGAWTQWNILHYGLYVGAGMRF